MRLDSLLAVTAYVQWNYAANAKPRLLSPEVTAAHIRQGNSRSLGVAGLSIIVALLTFWLQGYALTAFTATPLAMRLASRLIGVPSVARGEGAETDPSLAGEHH